MTREDIAMAILSPRETIKLVEMIMAADNTTLTILLLRQHSKEKRVGMIYRMRFV